MRPSYVGHQMPSLRLLRRLSAYKKLGQRGAGFLASTVVSAAASLVSFPVLISALGPRGWSSIALAQVVGSFAGVLTAWGWGAAGAGTIASMPEGHARSAFYRESLKSRLFLSLPAILCSTVALTLLDSGPLLPAMLVALAVLTSGALVPSWYFAGSSNPKGLFFCATIPVALGTITGSVAVSLSENPVWFGALQLAGAILAVVTSSIVISRGSPRTGTTRSIGRSLLDMRHGVFVSAIAALYVGLPVTVVSIAIPNQLPTYALMDRLFRLSATVITPVIQVLQGQIPGVTPSQTLARMRAALPPVIAAAAFFGAAFVAVAELSSAPLSAGKIDIPIFLICVYGGCVFAMMLNATISSACLLLIPGQGRRVVLSVMAGAGTGVVAVPVAGFAAGSLLAVGAAFLISELSVSMSHLAHLRRLLRNRQDRYIPTQRGGRHESLGS